MANKKISELDTLAYGSISEDDLLVIVDDVAGTATTKNFSFNSLRLALSKEKTSSPTISEGSLTLDLENSKIFLVDLNENITSMTINSVPDTTNSSVSFSIIFTMDGTPRTVTWPLNVKWSYDVAPTLSSTNSKKDIISFTTTDAGTNWFGFVGGQYY